MLRANCIAQRGSATLQACRDRVRCYCKSWSAADSRNQLLHQVCSQHGVLLDKHLQLCSTQWGLGLHHLQQHGATLQDQPPLVAVPLDLILSPGVPGVTQPSTPAETLPLLHSSAVSQAWEMQVAAQLLWALRQPLQSRFGFWQQYRPLLPRSLEDCSSLLVWSAAELSELQDPILEATAREWQQVVHAAYHSAVQPFFNGSTAAGTADDPRSSGSSSSSGGSSSGGSTSSRSGHESVSSAVDAIAGVGAGARSKPQQPCSLQEWLWAVATVESRAFGATRQDVTAAAAATAEASPSPSSSSSSIGQPGTPGDWAAADPTAQWAGLVPVLDLANHSPKPHYQHRLNPSAGAFCLCWDGSSSQQADAPAVASPAACSSSSGAGGAGDDSSQRSLQQVLITYGSKDNRQLMEQYGFSVAANPFDKVRFPPELFLQEQHGWMSHKAVRAAARLVMQQQQQQQQQEQSQEAAARVDAAVASVLHYRGWKNARQYSLTTPASTAACAKVMGAHVRQQLQAYRTTAADDAAAAVQLAQAPARHHRLRAALQYRLGQKLLLEATAAVLQEIAEPQTPHPQLLQHELMAPKAPMQLQSLQPGCEEPEDSVVQQWSKQYPLPPDETAEGSRADLKLLYRPPRNDSKGIAIACSIIAAWAVLFYHGCWQVKLTDAPDGSSRRSSWLDIAATFFLLEFANTGLFITTHDAMHGTICFRNRKLNDWVGRVAITLYAYFDYGMLHKKHWDHHGYTGQPGKDPDFHRGNTNVLAWFGRFMWEYTTLLQIAKIILASQVLQALGVPYANLCVYMAGAPILAAVRLFYFGTYLPHLPPDNKTIMNWQKSHSSEDPAWLTFLKCYHFGLHFEHHRFPYCPWWQLPQAKAITRQHKQQQEASKAQQLDTIKAYAPAGHAE